MNNVLNLIDLHVNNDITLDSTTLMEMGLALETEYKTTTNMIDLYYLAKTIIDMALMLQYDEYCDAAARAGVKVKSYTAYVWQWRKDNNRIIQF